MTKADIAREIAKKTGIDKVTTLEVIEEFMNTVKNSLVHGESVYLRGFGTFGIKERAEKLGRNISKNTTIVIPACYAPKFVPAPALKEAVKGR